MLGLLLALAALAAGTPARAAQPGPLRVVEATAAGVTLEYTAPALSIEKRETALGAFEELTLPGHLAAVPLGRPLLPGIGAALAVPEGMEGRVSWQVLERSEYDDLEPAPALEGPAGNAADLASAPGITMDRAAYGAGAPVVADGVEFELRGHLRHHVVGQLSVHPLRFEPATRHLSQVRHARIRVDFVPARQARAAGTAPPELIPAGAEPAWESTYQGLFLNYESARTFRQRPLPALDGLGDRLRRVEAEAAGEAAAAGGNPTFRMSVQFTGAYYVSYADLAALGWPDTVRVEQVRLFERALNGAAPGSPLEREIPCVVEDASGVTGRFDADDYLVFYGLNYKDRFNAINPNSRYTYLHNYWLTWRAQGGSRMPRPAGWYEAPSVTTPTAFAARTLYEENAQYIYFPPTNNQSDFPTTESFYWLTATSFRDSLDFATPAREPGGTFRLRARWQGVYRGNHWVSAWLRRGATGVDDTLLFFKQAFGSQDTYTYDSGFTLPCSRLADGGNKLKLQGNGVAENDINSEGSGAFFDWFEVTYPRRYTASAGKLRFTSAAARGDVEFVIGGLSATLPYVFDITDSLAPQQVDLANARFTSQGGRPPVYELRFRYPCDRQRTFWLVTPEALPPLAQATTAGRVPPDLGNKNLVRDDAATNVVEDNGADMIVLAHPSLQPSLARWITLRQGQGHRILMVSPQQVWNQFSGGDKSIPAIRTWLRYLYRNWSHPPDYLVLAGDASEDYRKDLGTSDPDYVPTMMAFGPVPGADQRAELIGSDNYFVGALDARDGDADIFPELHSGRLSASTPAEMDILVDKLVAYDTYSPDDAWRNRGLIVCDDQYSSSITGTGSYCYQGSQERGFEQAGDSLCVLFNRDACYTDFSCDLFKVGPYYDSAPELGRNVAGRDQPGAGRDCVDIGAHVAYSKAHVSPAWVQAASKGYLFQIYGGHANRFVMGTERFVEFNGAFSSPEYRTTDQLTNYGKPFIFIGAACHLNEFEHFQELDSKHSLAEAMMFLPGRGAIASIASSGYEWVYTNKPTEIFLGNTLFADHVRDPITGQPRAILGEGFDEGLLRLAASWPGGKDVPSGYRDTIKSYCLLGDPTMRIDMAPPKLAVEVNGAPLPENRLVAPPSGSNVLAVTARLADDVNLDAITLKDGADTVPADQYTLVPVNPDAPGACRGQELTWNPTVRPEDYDLSIAATDWLGRDLTVTLHVEVDAGFYSGNRRLTGNETLPVDAPFQVRVVTPVAVAAGDIEILVNDQPGYFNLTADDAEGRHWTGTLRQALPLGAVSLTKKVRGRLLGSPFTINVDGNPTLGLANVYFYPSPWSGEGTGRFLYDLTYGAQDRPSAVRINVYSVSGRKVASLAGGTELGPNQVTWDMTDEKGDVVANGVYLFRLALQGVGGGKVDKVDRLIVHR